MHVRGLWVPAFAGTTLTVEPDGLSVQLCADFRDALGQELVGDLALHRLRQDGGSGSDRGVGGGRADIGQRLGFGQRDLASAVLVRRATKSSILALASPAMRSASALALAMMSSASRSALARRASYSASTLAASSLRRRASSSSALMRSLRRSSVCSTVRWTPRS